MGKHLTPLTVLRNRIQQNFADFKAEMLMSDEESIFENASRIAAVTDTFEELMHNDLCIHDEDVEFLLNFYNPLEMIADFLSERAIEEDVDEALEGVFSTEGLAEQYLTIDFAKALVKKHGLDSCAKTALLMETIEVGEHYLKLLKLTNACNASDIGNSFISIGNDDGEGCF